MRLAASTISLSVVESETGRRAGWVASQKESAFAFQEKWSAIESLENGS
jgi:hypothetical protein